MRIIDFERDKYYATPNLLRSLRIGFAYYGNPRTKPENRKDGDYVLKIFNRDGTVLNNYELTRAALLSDEYFEADLSERLAFDARLGRMV